MVNNEVMKCDYLILSIRNLIGSLFVMTVITAMSVMAAELTLL